MTTAYPPVRMYQKGLPDWVVLKGKSDELARKHFEGEAFLRETRGTGFGRYMYVYEDRGGNRAFIDGRKGKVFTRCEAVDPTPHRSASTPNDRESAARALRIAEQWREFLESGIDLTAFSLNGLRDLSVE